MRKITKELMAKTRKELEKEAYKLRQEIGRLKLEEKVSLPKDTNLLKKKKKMLALILTLINEKRQIENMQKLTS